VEITRRTDYAIRLMLALAEAGGGPVSVRELAERQQVPYAFARGIQRELVAAGLATTRRGATGGLSLARPASEITLLDVIEAVEGPIALNICTADPDWCQRMGACSVHQVWRGADDLVKEYFGSKSLAGLVGGKE
jgi:Rrf2 family protein